MQVVLLLVLLLLLLALLAHGAGDAGHAGHAERAQVEPAATHRLAQLLHHLWVVPVLHHGHGALRLELLHHRLELRIVLHRLHRTLHLLLVRRVLHRLHHVGHVGVGLNDRLPQLLRHLHEALVLEHGAHGLHVLGRVHLGHVGHGRRARGRGRWHTRRTTHASQAGLQRAGHLLEGRVVRNLLCHLLDCGIVQCFLQRREVEVARRHAGTAWAAHREHGCASGGGDDGPRRITVAGTSLLRTRKLREKLRPCL
mmetsp:Transcript_1167/g.3177  ORF Transcript_1167/g.3177 Transcript_1167/m.3177 type:complete len:254 (+) Transcript_1167:925-1686(+)